MASDPQENPTLDDLITSDPDVFGGAAAMQLLKDRAASEVKAGNGQ